MDTSKPSKFRHTFGSVRTKSGYEGVKPRSTRDGSLIKANSSIVAVQWAASGFGALAVLPTRDGDQSGKSSRLVNPPLIEAHRTSIQDFDISPFNEHLVVTSDGGSIKLWQVPEGGLTETMRECASEVKGEAAKRLSALNFHPTSENLLTTCGKDFCLRLFDVQSGSPVVSLKEGFSDLILSTSWSTDGSLVATGCKDKMLRVADPRAGKIVHSTEAHPGVKGFMATWLGHRSQIVTSGFSKNGERQLSIWDMRAFNTALHTLQIDTSPGMITPYYDASTEMIFLLGRGDTNIRYYEVNDDEPYLHYLAQYRGAESTSDITPFAKRFVDVTICEVARFAKLTRDKIEHIMFQVPRKDSKESHIFHEDLYRYVPSATPSSTAQDWLAGKSSSSSSSNSKMKNGKVAEDIIYLTPQQLMPTGFKSIYEIDTNKKEEDEARETEKKAFQAMTMEERLYAKEAAKSAAQLAKRGGSGNDEEDEAADEATLAKFATRPVISVSGIAIASVSSSSASSSSSNNNNSNSSSSNKDPSSSNNNSSPSTSNDSKAASTPFPRLSVASATTASSGSLSLLSSPRQGNMATTLSDGSTYDGGYKHDQKHGTGTFIHKPDGSVYHGSWLDDKRSGSGQFSHGSGSSAIKVQGSWIDNVLDAEHAVFSLEDGCTFEFATLDKNGKITSGKLRYNDGEVYEGAFSASGKKHGQGVWRGKDGSKYEGEYKDDLRHGQGEYHYPDGGVFKGAWKSDMPDGKGVFYDNSGKVITGVWSKGKLTSYTIS